MFRDPTMGQGVIRDQGKPCPLRAPLEARLQQRAASEQDGFMVQGRGLGVGTT
jgi:hypothetical protein